MLPAPGEQGGALPACRRVEHPHDPFLPARRQPRAVGAEGDRPQRAGLPHPEDLSPLVASQTVSLPTCRPRRRSSPGGGQPAAVRATRRATRTRPRRSRAGPHDRPSRASQRRTSSPSHRVGRGDPGPVRPPGHAIGPDGAIRAVSRPVSGSQIRTRPSAAAWRAAGRPGSSATLARMSPSRSRESAARSTALSGRPLAMSQTRIVPSAPSVARRFPSGRKATARTILLVPDELVPDPAVGEADQVGRDGRARRAGEGGDGPSSRPPGGGRRGSRRRPAFRRRWAGRGSSARGGTTGRGRTTPSRDGPARRDRGGTGPAGRGPWRQSNRRRAPSAWPIRAM